MKKIILFLLTVLISHIALAQEAPKDNSIFPHQENYKLIDTNKNTPLCQKNIMK